MSIKPEIVVAEDRSALFELLSSSERGAISVTSSDGKTMTLPSDWMPVREPIGAGYLEIVSQTAEEAWSIDTSEIVRVNCLESGELLWETRRGDLIRPSTPAVERMRIIALFYLPILCVIMLNYFLGWKLFGEWDGIATLAGFLGAMLLISAIPRPAEII